MADAKSLLKGGAILTAGNMLSQILGLIRNIIVARLVGPEDFGVAVTFAVTLSVLEAALAHGFDKLLIQDDDGENPELQSMLHTILVGRGLLLGLILFLSAPFLAQAFDIPEATVAYQILALVPLIRGFGHLDMMRVQRHLNFAPSQWVQILSQLVGLLVAVFHALIFQNYWAMLWGIVCQLVVFTGLSHMIASRSYHFGWNAQFSKRVLQFSWPLMLNGIILALSSQADRLVVGAMLSLKELAIYGAASMLVTAILTILAKIAGDLSLPWIAKTKQSPDEYRKRHAAIGAAVSIGCIFVFAPIALLGGDIVTIFFGEDYTAPKMMIAWLAVAMGLRLLRVWPIVIAMSFGDTVTLMRSNIIRSVGLVALVIALQLGAGISGAAAAMALGEGLATLLAFIRLKKIKSEFMISFGQYTMLACIGLLASLTLSLILETLQSRIAASMVLSTLSLIILFVKEPTFFNLLRQALRSFKLNLPRQAGTK